ncbi:MAG: hypothetical protein MUF87_04370 [Anaerolineae bacterium]|nr:hypothetical protein [Anaerolineae bacterium]
MSESFKICPICDTPNHRNAAVCITCGTSLNQVSAISQGERGGESTSPYDYRYGETDLHEDGLRRKAQTYLAGISVVLVVIMVIGVVLMLAPNLNIASLPVMAQTQTQAFAFVTNTPRPTIAAPTVTQGPPTLFPSATPSASPTITPTFTPSPCYQTVQAGDGLYNLVIRCGHRDLDVIQEVIRLNNLNSETDIRAGETLEIPWPTPTLDPNVTEEPVAFVTASGDEALIALDVMNVDDPANINLTLIADPFFRPTPTLLPGVMYHVVSPDENAISISVLYNTNFDILRQLNPEVNFARCEFGLRFGGPDCIVLLGQGQQIRVPAPTPTITLSPTPSGSETATPTATATFNAPSAISPSNQAYFRRDEIVTLRWITTGTLGPNQTYLVTVTRVNDNQVFSGETMDLFFLMPIEWQGESAVRYEYQWTVSVIDLSDPTTLYYTTPLQTLTWEGRGGTP